ncbi:MAG: Lhr family helicase, partial [Thermoanaerobaculia bacterium]
AELARTRRAARVSCGAAGTQPAELSDHRRRAKSPPLHLFLAAERLPEFLAIHDIPTSITAPASRQKSWTRESAILELLRGRISILGPVTSSELASQLGIHENEAEMAMIQLESEGLILRGAFSAPKQWCDRRLLARIHRYTLNRLRAEIEPVGAADFMRFLFAWQHVAPSSRLMGVDGLQAVLAQLDGFEIAASAWERAVLPARITSYDASLLDTLCLSGVIAWARLSCADTNVVSATPIALFLREHADVWQTLRPSSNEIVLSDSAKRILEQLQSRGASFARDLGEDDDVQRALAELVSAGFVSSDGYAGLRALIAANARDKQRAGRWSLLARSENDEDAAIEIQARVLLRRYGIVCRRLLARETNVAPWRELARVYRRLEARGEIRGGRFVHGMSGEQFALPEAIERMREIRREDRDDAIVVISAADPLNLTGIITNDERIRAIAGTRIAYRNGVAVSVLEGEYLRPLTESTPEIAAMLAGRRVPVSAGWVGRSAIQ